MAVYVIDEIKQQNDANFAVVDSNNIRGGLYHADTEADMLSIPRERLKEGSLCYLKEDSKYYQYIDKWIEWFGGETNPNDLIDDIEIRAIKNIFPHVPFKS